MVAAFLIACDKENTSPEPEEPQEKITAPSISISSDRPVLYPSTVSTTITFTVESKEALSSVTASAPSGVEVELELSEDKKNGSAVLTGIGDFPESFPLTITATNEGGSTEASVDVNKAYIRTDRDSFQAKEAGASFVLEISSNVPIKVTSDSPEWLHAEKDGNSATVTVDRNKTYSERYGKVVVREPEGILGKEILVSQEASINYYEMEVAALKALYEATDGPNWTKLSITTGGLDISTDNWCSDKPLNQWYGVELNSEGHVMYLHLTSMGLKGTLPEEISNLIYCQELWLSGNSLAGPLPYGIGEMKSLKDIEADGMELSGDLSSSTLSKVTSHLKRVSLSGNLFTGGFPQWIGDMPASCNFWLQGNCLSGKIPDKVKAHPRWSEIVLDGSGKTVGAINMEQREGYTLTEE